jgi:hypothetical protein
MDMKFHAFRNFIAYIEFRMDLKVEDEVHP